MDLAGKVCHLVAFLLGSRALNCGGRPFELSDNRTVCQGCSQPSNQCGMLQVCGGTRLWSDHDSTFTLFHVIFAELGITRILTVVLSQCYCCCLCRAPQLLNKSFLSPHLACLPVMFLSYYSAWNRRITALPSKTRPLPL